MANPNLLSDGSINISIQSRLFLPFLAGCQYGGKAQSNGWLHPPITFKERHLTYSLL